jgi:hypothetical protein
MHEQLDLIDGTLNVRPDGSVELLGKSGNLVLTGNYAERIRVAYHQMLSGYPRIDSLKLRINIELPQPIGAYVNEN